MSLTLTAHTQWRELRATNHQESVREHIWDTMRSTKRDHERTLDAKGQPRKEHLKQVKVETICEFSMSGCIPIQV